MFHVELAPLGGIFGPLKSDLGVFWPFRGTDFIMGKNKNANFSKSSHGPIFKFFVVIREVILQKMAPILAPVNFFSVLTLIGDCELHSHRRKLRRQASPFTSAFGVTITGGGAQLHVDLNEATFRARKIFMAMVTFKANVVVVVQVHCKIVIHQESQATLFTITFFTGIRENKRRCDGV